MEIHKSRNQACSVAQPMALGCATSSSLFDFISVLRCQPLARQQNGQRFGFRESSLSGMAPPISTLIFRPVRVMNIEPLAQPIAWRVTRCIASTRSTASQDYPSQSYPRPDCPRLSYPTPDCPTPGYPMPDCPRRGYPMPGCPNRHPRNWGPAR